MRFLFLSLGCLAVATACRKPERPQGIPATAVAVGGAKHYQFIDCERCVTAMSRLFCVNASLAFLEVDPLSDAKSLDTLSRRPFPLEDCFFTVSDRCDPGGAECAEAGNDAASD